MLSLLIQQAIENRIAPLEEEALSLGGDPYGSDSRIRVQNQFWIAYQSSDYPTDAFMPDATGKWSQTRELEYQHYVEVEDFRRDYVQALTLHERLMGAVAGFRPNLEATLSPLRLSGDGVVSAKVEGEVVYRYRATYRIMCKYVPSPLLEIPPFIPRQFRYALWRSFVDEVAAPNSVKFAEGVIEVEEVD